MNISSKTSLSCIIGHPVSQSKSPTYYNEYFKEHNIDMVYLAFDIMPGTSQIIFELFKNINVKFMNLTMPFKKDMYKYLDFKDDTTNFTAASNLILNKNNKLYGYNTDGCGFYDGLQSENVECKNANITILGCSSTSSVIVYEGAKRGVKQFNFFIRNYDSDVNQIKIKKILEMKDEINHTYKLNLVINFYPLIDANKHKDIFDTTNILINSTPVGMQEGDKSLIEEKLINSNMAVVELLYNRDTQMLEMARNKGCKAMNGFSMFHYQFKKNIEILTKENIF